MIDNDINKNVRIGINDLNKPDSCQFNGTTFSYESINGEVNLSRVDIQNGIFSGTFSFILKTKYCGHYEVTNGRFDYKF